MPDVIRVFLGGYGPFLKYSGAAGVNLQTLSQKWSKIGQTHPNFLGILGGQCFLQQIYNDDR